MLCKAVISMFLGWRCVVIDASMKFCSSECSARKSEIIIIGRGGISERLSTYSKMSGVAAFLCARLVIPHPAGALAARYNNYSPVSGELAWSDLVEIQKPSLYCDQDVIIQSSSSSSSTTTATDSLTTVGTGGLRVAHNVSEALNLKATGTPFVWTLGDEIVTTPSRNLIRNITLHLQSVMSASRSDEVSPPFPTHIGELEFVFVISPLILRHSRDIMQNSNISTTTPDSFIALHVRRGDLKRACNSEIDAIPALLDSSLRTCPDYNTSTRTVSSALSLTPFLLFSDEGSVVYRSEVMREVRQLGFAAVVDGDWEIRQYALDRLPEKFHNNFVTFHIASAIRLHTRLKILLHGHRGCGHSKLCV